MAIAALAEDAEIEKAIREEGLMVDRDTEGIPGIPTGAFFNAVAWTASSLKRDRRFADSPLEGSGFEPPVPRFIIKVSRWSGWGHIAAA